ncbi:DUF3048 domain-containing protein [Oceanobacillus sp. AG]|uniref:DUF3048 domain-containing protein n=1 Tax=Oceanobacillus sp. AG TaxID=2681969 RepID=UPI0012EB86CE|nr:DUF3048 domain-containing protein [Oceanobacillus sp. AG]
MRKLIFITVIIGVLLVACSKDDGNASKQEGKGTGGDEKDGIEQAGGENQYPLTGLYTDEPVDNRIIGVMVNNHRQARPQSGLAEADIVFEILAEAKITRLLALFQSEIPDTIGPVRSAREYYFDLANRYGALYVYHGAADFIDQMIIDRGIPFLNGSTYDNDGQLFTRDSSREAPHNSYLLTDAINETAEGKGYEMTAEYEPLPFLNEEETAAIEGETAERVEIVYSENPLETVQYVFDESKGTYKRYSNEEETVDLNTGATVEVANVFIIETFHEVIDDAGRRNIDFDSGGNAYLIQNGKVQEVEWQNDNGRLVPMKDGQPVGFVPGKTWINVVPNDPGMEQAVTISN